MTASAHSVTSGWGLVAHWHALIDQGDPRFTRLSTVDDAAGPLEWVVGVTTTSLWNMQRHWTVHDLRDEEGLNDRARGRGVRMRLVLPRHVAMNRCPLAPSCYGPLLRLAPVAHPLLISDGQRILLGDSTGETVWTSSSPDVVGSAVAFYEAVWQHAVSPFPEGERPPFTRRMVDIALGLVGGATDREIARSLGVSERTVSGDVREMSARLGARSRAHAIALVSGLDG